MNKDLLERFCTPPTLPLTGYDSRVLAQATKAELLFEGAGFAVYRWGEGRSILLIHGWGSRASHLALIGQSLAKAGFNAVAPDMPAHSSLMGFPGKSTSNMFEYCRAISAVAKSIGPPWGIIGHSFGAICSAFVVAGLLSFADHRITADRLVLISTPPSLGSVLESFCRHDGSGPSGFLELKESLEEGFGFSVDGYSVGSALRDIPTPTLLVHDADDEEFPMGEIRSIHEAAPRTGLFVTQGSGHQRILANRAMITRVKDFLLETV
jgi:pimeloyl-ACP methyl ester carboxylesterase